MKKGGKLEGWKVEKLGDVCEKVQDGAHSSPKKTYPDKKANRYLYITSKNIRNDYVDLSNVAYVDEVFHQSIFPRCNPEFGDVLLTKDGANTGNVTLNTLKEPFSLLSSVCLIKPNKGKLSPAFLKYYIQSPNGFQNITGQMAGAAIKRIVLHKIKSAKIPVPPLPEQQRIVSVLDEAFASIAGAKSNTDRNLVNARELFQSYLDEIFETPGKHWETCQLDKYVKFIDYRGHTPTKTPSGMRLITAKNVKNDLLQRTPEEFVDPEIYDTWMVRGIPVKGDVLFTTEAPLANVAQLDTDEKVLFAQRIITFQPQQGKLDQTFLKYLLLSQPIRKDIFSKATGATVQGIKARLLKTVEIYFPPLAEQRAIVGRLEALSAETGRLEEIYRSKVEALEELKRSVLGKAFEGEL